jgi:hypothetical protein
MVGRTKATGDGSLFLGRAHALILLFILLPCTFANVSSGSSSSSSSKSSSSSSSIMDW